MGLDADMIGRDQFNVVKPFARAPSGQFFCPDKQGFTLWA
jgi:hypothetical protein